MNVDCDPSPPEPAPASVHATADLLRDLRTLDRSDPAAVADWTARKKALLAAVAERHG